MAELNKGKVHVYTGPGKGKTTAAMGLAVRAAGSGLKVSIYQFIKGQASGELNALEKIKNIKVIQCGRPSFIKAAPKKQDIECARRALSMARRDVMSGKSDLVILDEINVAIKLGLINLTDIIEVINCKPDSVELILTGRGAPKSLVAAADYATRFLKVKHPFDDGLQARRGIEY